MTAQFDEYFMKMALREAEKAASDQPPHVPAVRAQGEESTIAPMMISAIKPNAREKRLFI